MLRKYGFKSTLVTIIEASPPWDLWNSIISLSGYSLITSLLRTKKGSPESSNSLSLAKAKGPAVPSGSVSCEHVILISSFVSKSFKKLSITCKDESFSMVFQCLRYNKFVIRQRRVSFFYLWLIIDSQNHFTHSNSLESLYLINLKKKVSAYVNTNRQGGVGFFSSSFEVIKL